MDTTLQRYLIAIQPFTIEATTAKSPSPRFLKDLINRAISSPSTFTFSELLHTPAIQSLRTTSEPEYANHLTLLELFSYGTYQEYLSHPTLSQIPLTAAQTEKLRLLTLLSHASPFAPLDASHSITEPLTYSSLVSLLGLETPAQLEALVTTAIYQNLLTARLAPASNPPSVHITSVTPIRDPRPDSLPTTLAILQTWSDRCTSTINSLEAQIAAIKSTASQRQRTSQSRQEKVDKAVVQHENDISKGVRPRNRQGNKRDLDERMEGEYDEGEVSSDEQKVVVVEEEDTTYKPGSSKVPGGGGGGNRGSKRNRGRGGLFS